jgi:uncharacterized protein YecT (DUF1311 family)
MKKLPAFLACILLLNAPVYTAKCFEHTDDTVDFHGPDVRPGYPDLLFGLGGTVGKPKSADEGGPSQWESGVYELVYFNTRTGAFELTDRLRKANLALKTNDSGQAGQHTAEPAAVLSAESVGQESPEPSVTDRYKKADAELNAVYKKLLSSLSPSEKGQLQKEEQLWLTKRDLFAVIHAWQSWSPFPNASRIEGMAIATETRVAELRKRLSTDVGS